MIDVFRAFERREQRRQVRSKSNGLPLDQIPKGYLRWVAGNVPSLEPTLADAIDKAIKGEAIPDEMVNNDSDDDQF